MLALRQPERHQRHLQRRDRHADAERQRLGRQLPDGAALGHLREQLEQPVQASKTVSFQVDDGGAVDNLSNVATRTINLSTANDAPVVTTTAGNSAYTEGAAAVAVDGGLTVSDEDDTNIESGVVRISANFESGDTLTFTNQNGITRQLQHRHRRADADRHELGRQLPDGAALDHLRNTTDDNLTSARRRSSSRSTTATWTRRRRRRTSTITAVNDAPVLTTTSGSASFTENGQPPWRSTPA